MYFDGLCSSLGATRMMIRSSLIGCCANWYEWDTHLTDSVLVTHGASRSKTRLERVQLQFLSKRRLLRIPMKWVRRSSTSLRIYLPTAVCYQCFEAWRPHAPK